MTAHKAVFFTLDEVNRLKIIQVVVDRYLPRYRESCPQVWLTAIAENQH